MPEIRNDTEYRELSRLAARPGQPPEALRRAQSALGRYRSLNPHVGSELSDVESLEHDTRFQANEVDPDAALAEELSDNRPRPSSGGRDQLYEDQPEYLEAENKLTAAQLPQRRREAHPELDIPYGDNELRDEAAAEGALKQQAAQIPNASQDPDFYVPPEFMPKGSDFDNIMRAQRHFEPTLADFYRERGQDLLTSGIDPKTLDETSDEFRYFADEKWADTYARAEAAGIPVVRDRYARETGGRALVGSIQRGVDTIRGGVIGAVESFMPGGTSAAQAMGELTVQPEPDVTGDDFEGSAERHPGAQLGGAILGGLAPSGLGNRLATGAYRALAPAGAGLGRRLGAAGVGGGLAGTGGGITYTANEMLSGDDSAEEVAAAPLLGVAAGVGGGMLGEALGSAAKAGMKSLRESPRLGEKLELAEKAGYQTSALSGVKPTPELQARIDEARSRGVRHPYAEMAEDVAQRGAQVVHDLQAANKRDLGVNVEKYYSWADTRPQTHRAPVKTVQRAIDIIKSMRTEEGGDAGFVNSTPFRKELAKMLRAHVVPEDQAKSTMTASNVSKSYTFEELGQLGFTPREILEMSGPRAPQWLKDAAKRPDFDAPVGPDTGTSVVDPAEVGAADPFDFKPTHAARLTDDAPAAPSTAPPPAATQRPIANSNVPGRPELRTAVPDPRAANANARGPENSNVPDLGTIPDEGGATIPDADEPVTVLEPRGRGWRVVLEPIRVSPRVFDGQVEALDHAAGAARMATGKNQPKYAQLMEAAHADREKFPAHAPYASGKNEWEVSDSLGGKRKVRGWAALKAQHYDTKLEQEKLAEDAGFPAEMPNRAPRQVGAPKGQSVRPPKLVDGETLPTLGSEEWKRVTNVVMNLHGPGNENAVAAQRAWKELANNPKAPFAEELARVAGTRFGEELRHGEGALRGVVGTSFKPSLYTSLGQRMRLRVDAPMRGLSGEPAESAGELVGPNLRRLLDMMRTAPRKPTDRSVTLGQHVFGLRGGTAGARSAAVAQQELDEEDLQNLRRLVQARQTGE